MNNTIPSPVAERYNGNQRMPNVCGAYSQRLPADIGEGIARSLADIKPSQPDTISYQMDMISQNLAALEDTVSIAYERLQKIRVPFDGKPLPLDSPSSPSFSEVVQTLCTFSERIYIQNNKLRQLLDEVKL